MRVRFWGVRGSVPTPGPSTVRYGGNTVCAELRVADGSLIVLDAGTGLRELGKALAHQEHPGSIAMLLTHLHWDHILGIPFFKPLYDTRTHVRVYPMSNDAQQSAMQRRALFDGVHFPVRAADVPATLEFVEAADAVWRIGSANVRRIALNHPGGAQGFRIDDDGGKSIAYLTDNELSPPGVAQTSLDALARFAEGVDVLVHDAQYFAEDMPAKRGWGHSTIDDVLELAKLASPRRLVLFHHDPDRNDDELDALEARASAWLHANAPATRACVAREGWVADL